MKISFLLNFQNNLEIDFYTASSESYIAVKMNGSKCGWIKIDASDPKNPKIVSFEIQE